ncbi:MAG: hypothetical protein EBT45_08835 [Alphaproteobacteria bacterium]|nr:hypothetical protein [Alphaproteobacteria bacterium]
MKKPQQRRKTELEIPNKNPLLSFQKSLNCDEKYRALPQYYLRTLKMLYYSHPASLFDIFLMVIALIVVISLAPKDSKKIE